MSKKPETLNPIQCHLAMRKRYPIRIVISHDRETGDTINVWTAARDWCQEQFGDSFNEIAEGSSSFGNMRYQIDQFARWGAYGTMFYFDDPDLATMFRVTWG